MFARGIAQHFPCPANERIDGNNCGVVSLIQFLLFSLAHLFLTTAVMYYIDNDVPPHQPFLPVLLFSVSVNYLVKVPRDAVICDVCVLLLLTQQNV